MPEPSSRAWTELAVPALIVLHVVVWTLVPSLVNPNLPLDVIEGLLWGQAWQLGYDKHPPLMPWLLEGFAALAPGQDWPAYLLSALSVAVAFWALWRLARDFVPAAPAALSVLLLEGVYYHNFTIPEFNPNVLQLPFWALSVLCLWRGLKSGSVLAWGLFGLFGALGLLTKYFTVFLILALGAYLVFERSGRAAWRTPGPYIAMGVGLAVLAPHLVWMLQHDFPSVTYALQRSGAQTDSTLLRHAGYPAKFLLAQILAGLALVVLFCALGRPRWRPEVSGPQARFLLAAALGPLILVLIVSAVFGLRLRSMWGAPILSFAGLLAVAFFQARDWNLRRFTRVWAGIFLLAPAVYLGLALGQPYFASKGKRVHFPGRALAQEVEAAWQARFEAPLRIVIGDTWVGGNVGAYAASRPEVYIDGDPGRSAWLDDASVQREGAVVVWHDRGDQARPSEPFGLAARFACLEPAAPITLSWDTGAELPPLRFGVALIAPATQCPK